MPVYTYRCSACDVVYERRHSIKEKLTDCEECREPATLIRIPPVPLILKKEPKDATIGIPGSVVNKHIADVKEELAREKEELSKKEY